MTNNSPGSSFSRVWSSCASYAWDDGQFNGLAILRFGSAQFCVFSVAELLYNSHCLSVRQFVRNEMGEMLFSIFSAAMQDRRLIFFVNIPYVNEHPVCNSLCPSVCQSCYKI